MSNPHGPTDQLLALFSDGDPCDLATDIGGVLTCLRKRLELGYVSADEALIRSLPFTRYRVREALSDRMARALDGHEIEALRRLRERLAELKTWLASQASR